MRMESILRLTSTAGLLVFLVLSAPSLAYIEVVPEEGSSDTAYQLTCRLLNSRVGILSANFTPNDKGQPRTFRSFVNQRCSGINHCNFRLQEDVPGSETWGPGQIQIRYGCMAEDQVTSRCNVDLSAIPEGFVHTPGYPQYWTTGGAKLCQWRIKAPAPDGQRMRVTVLDESLPPETALRFTEPGEEEMPIGTKATDPDEISEEEEEGAEKAPRVIESQGRELIVTLEAKADTSDQLAHKRGLLFHYKAVGCPGPKAPEDGYVALRNTTHALIICCVGFHRAEGRVGDRETTLKCLHGNRWSGTIPLCVQDPHVIVTDNLSHARADAIIKEQDFVLDIMLPTVLICVLLLGNAGVVLVILYLRRRRREDRNDAKEPLKSPKATTSQV